MEIFIILIITTPLVIIRPIIGFPITLICGVVISYYVGIGLFIPFLLLSIGTSLLHIIFRSKMIIDKNLVYFIALIYYLLVSLLAGHGDPTDRIIMVATSTVLFYLIPKVINGEADINILLISPVMMVLLYVIFNYGEIISMAINEQSFIRSNQINEGVNVPFLATSLSWMININLPILAIVLFSGKNIFKKEYPVIIIIFFCLVFVGLSNYSLNAVVGILLCIIFSVYQISIRGLLKHNQLALILIIVALVLSILVFASIYEGAFTHYINYLTLKLNRNYFSSFGRLYLLFEGVQSFVGSFIVGNGFWDYPFHSFIIQTASDGGVIYLILWIVLLIYFWRTQSFLLKQSEILSKKMFLIVVGLRTSLIIALFNLVWDPTLRNTPYYFVFFMHRAIEQYLVGVSNQKYLRRGI